MGEEGEGYLLICIILDCVEFPQQHQLKAPLLEVRATNVSKKSFFFLIPQIQGTFQNRAESKEEHFTSHLNRDM